MKPRLQIIVASTRPTRFADKPLAWLVERLAKRDGLEFEILDMRDHPLALYDLADSPARTPREYAREDIVALGRALDRADGYIVLTSEYNHGYPASLKNALDHVFVELNRKPVSFLGYGGVGAARAIEQLHWSASNSKWPHFVTRSTYCLTSCSLPCRPKCSTLKCSHLSINGSRC